jgi:hypothetical protein
VVRTYASARTQTSLNRAKFLREFATPIIEASVGNGVGFDRRPFPFETLPAGYSGQGCGCATLWLPYGYLMAYGQQ